MKIPKPKTAAQIAKDKEEKPFTYKDFNLWRTYRRSKRAIFAWVGLAVTGIWLYYFGVNMNYIELDCNYLEGYDESGANITMVTNRNTFKGRKNTLVNTYQVSYDFRIICVIGVSCFSLFGFISCAQVMKPLYILLCFVLPYTMTAYVWWFIFSYATIHNDAAKKCSSAEELQASVVAGNATFN
jgi:hypothetical protein